MPSGARDSERLRELAPQVLAALTRRYRDFEAAEDAVQEALLSASQKWPSEGVPDNPRAWLIRVASRRLTDELRGNLARTRREERDAMATPAHEQAAPGPDSDAPEKDDSLLLLFLCCHPALSRASSIALTLRAVGGLSTAEIARAFLVPEATMAQRISRAKQQIKSSGLGFELPQAAERAARLESVLHVLYLIFNEGYAVSSGDELQRVDLSSEAIRLTRLLHASLTESAEVAGLLALMLLTDARRHARTGPEGELIPLDEQDRALWQRESIDEGVALVSQALQRGPIGVYQLQAAIAACHDEAPSTEATDWPQILALYAVLEQLAPNPMITLNRAVAVAMVSGPEAGLALLKTLEDDSRLRDHHRLAAVRAHLLERAGQGARAVEQYRLAAGQTTSTRERDYLLLKAARLKERLD